MDKRELRAVVFDVLRKTPHTHFRAVENDVRKASETYERRDVLLLNEILWELLRQGILAPGKNSLNPDLPFIHVTDYGTRCLDAGAVIAHDPDRYIEHLRAETEGRAPESVYESARIGLLSYLDGRFEASMYDSNGMLRSRISGYEHFGRIVVTEMTFYDAMCMATEFDHGKITSEYGAIYGNLTVSSANPTECIDGTMTMYFSPLEDAPFPIASSKAGRISVSHPRSAEHPVTSNP